MGASMATSLGRFDFTNSAGMYALVTEGGGGVFEGDPALNTRRLRAPMLPRIMSSPAEWSVFDRWSRPGRCWMFPISQSSDIVLSGFPGYCCLRSSWARSICLRTPRNRSHALCERCLASSTDGIRNQWARTYMSQRLRAARGEG